MIFLKEKRILEGHRRDIGGTFLEFSSAGGQVIFVKCLPTASDRIGRDDEKLDDIVRTILKNGCLVNTPDEVLTRIGEHSVPDFACGVEMLFFSIVS